MDFGCQTSVLQAVCMPAAKLSCQALALTVGEGAGGVAAPWTIYKELGWIKGEH
jgi:hypothetical protein